MFFVSKKHHLLLFRIYSLQKASLRHFCQLKADFYVDFKGYILHNRLEFIKSRLTQKIINTSVFKMAMDVTVAMIIQCLSQFHGQNAMFLAPVTNQKSVVHHGGLMYSIR